MNKILFLSVVVLILLASCTQGQKTPSDTNAPAASATPFSQLKKTNALPTAKIFQKIGSDTVENEVIVEMYKTTDTLKMKYNPLYFRILNMSQDSVITDARLRLETFMGMNSNGHGSPVIPPVFDEKTQMYAGGAIFSMPGTWQIKLSVNHHPDADIPVKIDYPIGKQILMTADNGADGELYNVSLVTPETWRTGENNLSVLINTVADDVVTFPPVNGLQVMVHPSPDGFKTANGQPLSASLSGSGKDGIYSGTIKLPQAGTWNLDFEFGKDGKTLVKQSRMIIEF